MRLVFVSGYYPPYTVGGAEQNTFALAQELASRGHEVAVVAPRLGPQPPLGEIPVETVDVGVAVEEPGRPLRPRVFDRPRFQWRLSEAIRRRARGADVVHCHSLELLPAAYVAARRAGVPVVATLQDMVGVCPLTVCLLAQDRVPADCGIAKLERECVPTFRALYPAPSRARVAAVSLLRYLTARGRSRLLRRCDGIFAVGSDLGPLYGAAGLLDGSRVDVLPNIAELPAAAHGPNGGSRPYALFAGRVTPGKGARHLLAAVALVRDRAPDFRLLVAGYADEAWRARLAAAAGVEHVGRVDRGRLAELYAGARLAVVPSVWPEPLGRSVLEAAVSSVPAVASAVGGIRDTVVDGATGLLVPPRDHEALARAILELWNDPGRAAAMGAEAARFVDDRFGRDRIGDRAEQLYASAAR